MKFKIATAALSIGVISAVAFANTANEQGSPGTYSGSSSVEHNTQPGGNQDTTVGNPKLDKKEEARAHKNMSKKSKKVKKDSEHMYEGSSSSGTSTNASSVNSDDPADPKVNSSEAGKRDLSDDLGDSN